MTTPSKQRGQILILLATWLFFGGGGSSAVLFYEQPVSEMKKAVEHVITDGGRRGAILSEIDLWESIREIQNEEVSEHREELLKTLRHKDAQRSELEPILAKLDKTFLAMDWDFLNLRFRVKEKVTSAEWADIAAPPKR